MGFGLVGWDAYCGLRMRPTGDGDGEDNDNRNADAKIFY